MSNKFLRFDSQAQYEELNLYYLFGTIKRLTYWGRRISNTELFRITK